jgi:hypothetical protein
MLNEAMWGQGYGRIIKEIRDWYMHDINVLRAEHEAKLASQASLLSTQMGFTKEQLALFREPNDWQFQRSLDPTKPGPDAFND